VTSSTLRKIQQKVCGKENVQKSSDCLTRSGRYRGCHRCKGRGDKSRRNRDRQAKEGRMVATLEVEARPISFCTQLRYRWQARLLHVQQRLNLATARIRIRAAGDNQAVGTGTLALVGSHARFTGVQSAALRAGKQAIAHRTLVRLGSGWARMGRAISC
jgi:hypothetical protein